MATLSRKLSVFSDGSVKAEGERLLPSGFTFVRILHEKEVLTSKRNVPPKMPEVRPMFPNHHVAFGKHYQLLAWKGLNPLLRDVNMTAVYETHLWITNDQGLGDSNDPRANYFENVNLTYPLPRVECLTCGGNILRVIGETRTKTGDGLEDCYIVETLDADNPAPSIEWLEARPWLITHAVKLDADGNPTRFPQGYNHLGYTPGVRHPLMGDPSRFTITIPKWRCVKWTEATMADPYRVYSPV